MALTGTTILVYINHLKNNDWNFVVLNISMTQCNYLDICS